MLKFVTTNVRAIGVVIEKNIDLKFVANEGNYRLYKGYKSKVWFKSCKLCISYKVHINNLI